MHSSGHCFTHNQEHNNAPCAHRHFLLKAAACTCLNSASNCVPALQPPYTHTVRQGRAVMQKQAGHSSCNSIAHCPTPQQPTCLGVTFRKYRPTMSHGSQQEEQWRCCLQRAEVATCNKFVLIKAQYATERQYIAFLLLHALLHRCQSPFTNPHVSWPSTTHTVALADTNAPPSAVQCTEHSVTDCLRK